MANDNDWIVIQDGDIIYLTSDWGARIHKALEMDGDKFGLMWDKPYGEAVKT